MPKPFDALTRALLERHPADWLALLGLGHGAPARVVDSDLSTVTAEADKVVRVEADPPWIVHVEVQASYDTHLPRRLLRYNALLNVRHDLPVHSAVVLLWPEADGPAVDGVLRQQSPDGRCRLEFHYQTVRVWELPVDDLAAGLGTIPLAALAVRSADELAGVVARMRAAFDQDPPASDEGELWTALYILIGRRFDATLANRLLQGVRAMEESVTYQAILEKGRQEGQLSGELRLIMRQATARFGPADESVRARLEAIDDLERLEVIGDRVLTAVGWDDLLAE